MSRNLIIFTDSGDTIIDEGTQVFDERGIVTSAQFIPGAGQVLRDLYEEGFRIALVADGEWESFQNVYQQNGLGVCFEQWIVSEVVGKQKPARIMFDTAMEKMSLTEADKPAIVMIGNNLRKDIAGANQYGITSIWLDWSPRYFHEAQNQEETPDYVVKTPQELKELLLNLDAKLEEKKEIDHKIKAMVNAFTGILYEEDDTFLKNMENHNLAGDDINRYRFWEWTQGVGLYGIWKLFLQEKDNRYLDIIRKYYDRQLEIGFPSLNVNTVTPYLTMALFGEYTGEEKYLEPCKKVAWEIMREFPRTKEGGFQHMTSDSVNEEELWDDTLYMTVLFLANMGRILGEESMVEEAQYQFLLHAKYLCDRKEGLWYHGWTFLGRHNFADAFWGRGNCWVTMVIPEFLTICPCSKPIREYLVQLLENQVESLVKYQEKDGMWHTLVDDKTSYVEASATCGFAYGILKGVRDGLLPDSYEAAAKKALRPILDCISPEGVVNQVSYGTPMGRESKDFYKQIPIKPMPYGQALALLFLMEYRSSL